MTRRPLLLLLAALFLLAVSLALRSSDERAVLLVPIVAVVSLLALMLSPLATVLVYNRTVVPRVHQAVTAYSLGDLARAQQVLDALERSFWRRMAAPNLDYLRALIAFRQGDLAASRRHLDATLAAPVGWLLRPAIFMLRASARGLRALVAALSGDRAQATADIDALSGDLDAAPDAHALAALTQAILMLRDGKHTELQRHLARHRSLLLGASIGRALSLSRALLRPWVIPGRDAYRSAADAGEVPSDEGTGWLLRIAPELAPLLAERPLDEGPAVEPPRPAAAPPAPVALPAPRPGAVAAATRRKTVLWSVIAIMFTVFWQVLGASEPPRPAPRSPRTAASAQADARSAAESVLAMGGLGGAMMIGLFAFVLFQMRTRQQRAHAADLAVLRGDVESASAFYESMTSEGPVMLRVLGASKLATVAMTYGDPADALRWTGFGHTAARQLTPSVRFMLGAPLFADEAIALALLGRAGEARASLDAMATQSPGHMLLPSARFLVDLIGLTRAGDLAAARALATRTPELLLLRLQGELLADLLTATGEGAQARDRVTSLLREAASEPRLGAWLERAAPALMSEARTLAHG